MNKKMKTLASALAILLAIGIAIALYSTRPKTKRASPKRQVPLVSTVRISPGSEKVFITAYGNVIPARKIDLLSEVQGKIIRQSDDLVPGGMLRKGSFILQVDSRDYDFQIQQEKAGVAKAEYDLALEEGQQAIAREEWELFKGYTGTDPGQSGLALREPHLKAARAKLQAARAKLQAAELLKDKTIINAPFNVLVLKEFVDLGQLISPQKTIATLVDTDRFWVQASVPQSMLSKITFPGGRGGRGGKVRILLGPEGGAAVTRPGRVFKALGDLDEKGRMARILIEILEPLKESPGTSSKMLLGSYVRAEIEAGTIEDVYVIPRSALRDNDAIWLLTPGGTLALRDTVVRWRREADVLVRAEIKEGERLITSRLQSALPGMSLRDAGADTRGSGR